MTRFPRTLRLALAAALTLLGIATAQAACRDAVVMVHGNSGSPSHFDALYNKLRAEGYSTAEIFRPSWGSRYCAACNDHYGSEETPVRSALQSAVAKSCTGKIDVLGHSMGVTLAAQQIMKLGIGGKVDSYVGIAGALRGLNSCGVYPFNTAITSCGRHGLSIGSPFLDSIYGKRFGARMYSIKSYADQVVCVGSCYVWGTHTSNIWNQNGSRTFNTLGHMGLVLYTGSTQYDLIR